MMENAPGVLVAFPLDQPLYVKAYTIRAGGSVMPKRKPDKPESLAEAYLKNKGKQ